MNTFKFFKEIELNRFKQLHFRLTGKEVNTGEEWSSFKSELVSWLILNQGLDIDVLKTNFGFRDEGGIYRFLMLPEIRDLLMNKIQVPIHLLTPTLLQKIHLCKQQTEKAESPILELRSLLALYPVFEFIKHLTDEEIILLEPYTDKVVRDYFKGSTLHQVRTHLNELNSNDFEHRYQACFAGLAENILASIINRLRLHLYLTKGLALWDEDAFLIYEPEDDHSHKYSKRKCTVS
ncbi:MAG: hypothetical protein BGO90_08045 [Legionella sp. 40-6]|nr:hypothetical protein [Legionella sp.]OJY31305.1 MAG: hypothetical protein BGO90_08045 [Legionella sp. 40-6]